jgi:hypothetical protein
MDWAHLSRIHRGIGNASLAQGSEKRALEHYHQALTATEDLKGLHRVESGGDLQIAYQAAIDQEKQFDILAGGEQPE